jgi:uncharacterized coiled-coil protein SlyX
MTENIESLILEHLRHMRGAIDRTEDRLDTLTVPVGRIETDIAQMHVALAEHSTRFDRIAKRLDRIERRLELVEVP